MNQTNPDPNSDPNPASESTPATTPAVPPSATPPRGPRLATLIAWCAFGLLMLVIGIWASGPLRTTFARAWAAVRPAADSTASTGDDENASDVTYYTCGMHPWVILPAPGLCPICHMDLTPLDPDKFTGEISIDPIVAWNIGVRIAPVVVGPVVRTIHTVGTIDYDESRVRDVNTKIGGWVEKLYVDYLGAEVEAGGPLFDLYSPELYGAQEEYLLAYRGRGRKASGAAPSMDSSTPDLLESARTRLEYFDITAEQIGRLEKSGVPAKTMTVHSPYKGVVIAKHANEGMKVDPGMQVYRIADLSKVWVMVTLYEYQVPHVTVGQNAVMTLPYVPGLRLEGKVLYIYPYLDPMTRQLNVRLEFDNANGLLKPGMFANVELRNTVAEERVLAPRTAILDTGARKVAFVSLGEGKFEPRDVRLGVDLDDGMVQVLDGLRPGEMIVTSGQFLLDSEAKVRDALARMLTGTMASGQEAVVAVSGASELASLPPKVDTEITRLLGGYFAIGTTLAGDTLEGAAANARTVAGAVDALLETEIPEHPHFWHQHDEIATVRGAALELAMATDLEAARLRFADMSIALSKLVRATGVPPGFDADVYELHCPMYRDGQGGSIWLQPKGDVRNPFYGSVMLECFDERSVLPVTGGAASGEAPRIGESPVGNAPPPTAPDADPSMPAQPAVALELDAPTQARLDEIFATYFEIAAILAKDETEGIAERFESIRESIAALSRTDGTSLAEISKSIEATASMPTGDQDELRDVFETVSDALIAAVQVAPASNEVAPAVYEVYCPMVKKSWLQPFEEVTNPYAPYMLRCGQVKRTTASRATGEAGR